MSKAYIFDSVRSPRGKGRHDGSLHSVTPLHLASQIVTAISKRNGLVEDTVEDLILGCVTPIGDQGGNIARLAALHAQLGQRVAGYQINRFCASGLEAVNSAATQINSGAMDPIIAGGAGSMSRCPIGSQMAARCSPTPPWPLPTVWCHKASQRI